MQKIFLFLFCFLIMLLPQKSFNQGFCGNANYSFQDGENLEFVIYYTLKGMWVAAGKANFYTRNEALNGKNTYHITGVGKTFSKFDWFFKVQDVYETFIDKNTLLPYKFVRNVNEGGFKIYNNVIFNHNTNRAISTNGAFNIKNCTHDVLSAIFYARTIDYNSMKPYDNLQTNVFLDDKNYNIKITYLGKETIKTRYGTYKAIKIMPQLIAGTVFKEGTRMYVWVSDDQNHIPLRIESPITVGKIMVDLSAYSGLKNPLNSKI